MDRDIAQGLRLPVRFVPVYQHLVWGGRHMALYRQDLPPGPIGESWEISQQARGMSVVAEGSLAGIGLDALMAEHGRAVVGDRHVGSEFPLLVKWIDAQQDLSIQVHPDDELARSLGLAERGKTECWYVVGNGGHLYQGTMPGTTREAFAAAVQGPEVAGHLNHFPTADGDCFFIPARTVHAIGGGTMIWEVQQSCDCTLRVSDWGRLWDGQARELHVEQSLATIDFSDRQWGPLRVGFDEHPGGGDIRRLVSCPYFTLEERRAVYTVGGGHGRCSIVIVIEGYGHLATAIGGIELAPMQCALVPAVAGAWSLKVDGREPIRALVAQPL